MKKVLILVCLAFICQLALAQTAEEKKKKVQQMYGIAIGLTYANIVGKHEDNSGVLGGQAGVYLALLKARNYMLTTYLLYTMMGAQFDNDSKYRLGYLVLPFVFQYMLFTNFYMGLGLQPGLLLAAKQKYNDQSYDVKDNMKKFNLAIPILLTYYLTQSLSLGLGVEPGVTKIFENSTNTARNFSAGLKLTFAF